MRPQRARQRVIALLLAYAAALAWHCPCPKVLSCHKWSYFLSVGGATAIVLSDYGS